MLIMYRGSPSMRDYRPVADVNAGDGIVIGPLLYIAHSDIPANELGALATPSGQAGYRATLAAGAVFADGDPVTWNPATGETGGAAFLGYAEGAADQTAGDTEVAVCHAKKAAV